MDVNKIENIINNLDKDKQVELAVEIKNVEEKVVSVVEDIIGLSIYIALTFQENINKEKATGNDETERSIDNAE